jgi:hypothetical protein
VWAGVDNAWEQEKPEARKMPENAADSHTSGARFVRLCFIYLLPPKNASRIINPITAAIISSSRKA